MLANGPFRQQAGSYGNSYQSEGMARIHSAYMALYPVFRPFMAT